MARRSWGLVLTMFVSLSTAAADEFDRHGSYFLRQGAKTNAAVGELSSSEAGKLKKLSAKLDSPCVVVRTDQGNWAKSLINWGFRRGSDGGLTPVLMLERYVTYDGQRDGLALVFGKDVMLFPGYQFNFDIGQIVPEGQGGDVQFTTEKTLKSLGEAKLHPLQGPQTPAAEAVDGDDPLDHEGVLPRDFGGAWRLDADGRIQGKLTLSVDDERNVQGQFFSEETKSVYPVKGVVQRGQHRATFAVEFLNAPHVFDAWLWTKDKSAMAGSVDVGGERKVGFFAVRSKADAAEKKP